MRSWNTVASRGTCAMFGNGCCSLLHHQRRLISMKFASSLIPTTVTTLIAIIVISSGANAAADSVQFANSFPAIISTDRQGSKYILGESVVRQNASGYFTQQLHKFKKGIKLSNLHVSDMRNENGIAANQRFIDNEASIDRTIQSNRNRFAKFQLPIHTTTATTTTTTINVEEKQQQRQQRSLRKKFKLLQQALTTSPPLRTHPKFIASKFSRLTNRQDCNDSDCLRNNDAISLYIPRKNSTNDGQPPSLLLLINNPSSSSSSSSRKNRNLQQINATKLSKLHTEMKIVGPDVDRKSLLPPPVDSSSSSLSSYHHGSRANARVHGEEYDNVKLSEASIPMPPPFAGGAELTDFIQPADTTVQNHRLYESIIPNHVSSGIYYGKSKHYLLSAPTNRDIYDGFHPAPLTGLNSKPGIYEPVTFPSPDSVYSTYTTANTDNRTSSSYYQSKYDLYSGGTVDDSNVSENMLQGITSEEELINSKNVKNDVNTYPYPSPQYTTTTNYEPQLSAKELGPAPPSVMPVIDYSEEQKQITDTTGYNSAIPVHCANIAAPLETNYATNVGFTYPTTPEFTTIDTDTTTTTTATTTTLLCVTQISNNYKQAVGINKTPTIPTTTTTTNFAISEASMEEGRNSAIEFMPDGYETTKIAEDVQLTHQRTPTPTPQATVASNIEMATTSKSKFEQLENFPTDYSQPSQMLTAHPTQLPSNVTATTAVTSRVTATSTGIVRNRLRGKARLTCKQDGLQFEINTLFPFTGQIFAHDRKHAAECYFTFDKATLINVTMSYATCGMRNSEEQRPETQYHMKIIVVFQQRDNTSTMQSFLTQCMHQKIQYQKQVIPKRIEEALEELRLIPTKLEHKAQVPECMMRIVAEEEHGHGDDGTETEVVNIGQPMRIEWSLVPESDAYGFHVRNCTVRDTFSNEEYMVIDQQGCSTDINIFTHPHYDTYHDIARVHWHAFKVPDINQLTIKCSIEICTDIPDTVSGLTSCDSIPSPPFCPDLITSATNALLSDPELKVIRKRRENKLFQQYVHADICFGDKTDEYCSSETYRTDYERHIKTFNNNSSKQYCLSRLWLGISTGLSALTVLLAITVHGYCRYLRRQRYGPIKLAANFTPPPPSSQQQ